MVVLLGTRLVRVVQIICVVHLLTAGVTCAFTSPTRSSSRINNGRGIKRLNEATQRLINDTKHGRHAKKSHSATSLQMRGGSNQVKEKPKPLSWIRHLFATFLYSLWKGITLPFPLLRRLITEEKPTDPTKLSIGLTVRDSLVAIFLYLCMGVGAYSVVLEQWPILDALYFSVVTFTTVGYGDLCPTTFISKIFTCFFGLGGVAFLGAALASIGSNLVQAELSAVEAAEKASRKRMLDLFDKMPNVVNQARQHGIEQAKEALGLEEAQQNAPRWWSRLVKLGNKMLPSFGFLCLGGVLMGRLEGWSWKNAVYYSIITAGTVGYGDFSPTSPRARLWALLYIPLAVAAAGEVLGALVSPFFEHRQRNMYKAMMERDLTNEGLKRMDANNDGKVTKREYVEFMLVEMGLVDEEQLDELHQQFNRLDVNGSGHLDQEDLKVMAKLRRESMGIYE